MSVGQSIVQQVIERLRAGGVDAIRAYPAEKLTELTGVRAAVSLKSMDPGNGTATALAWGIHSGYLVKFSVVREVK